jgi:hypothetical protein
LSNLEISFLKNLPFPKPTDESAWGQEGRKAVLRHPLRRYEGPEQHLDIKMRIQIRA